MCAVGSLQSLFACILDQGFVFFFFKFFWRRNLAVESGVLVSLCAISGALDCSDQGFLYLLNIDCDHWLVFSLGVFDFSLGVFNSKCRDHALGFRV